MNTGETHPSRGLLSLMELNPSGMALIRRDGQVIEVNRAFLQICGVTSAQVIGQSEADFNAHLRNCPVNVQRCSTDQFDLRAIYYVHSTDRREAVEQKMGRVAQLLREPLASIQGFTELLLTEDYPEDLRKDLTATLLDQVERLANMINEHLDRQ